MGAGLRILVWVFCLLSCCFLLTASGMAQVYKWVDEDGKVHFSDKKPATQSAEELDIKVNTYTRVSYEAGEVCR